MGGYVSYKLELPDIIDRLLRATYYVYLVTDRIGLSLLIK